MFNSVKRYSTIEGLNPFYKRINIDFNNFEKFNLNFYKFLYHVSLRNENGTAFSLRNIEKLGKENLEEFFKETILFKNIWYNIEIKNETELEIASSFLEVKNNERIMFFISDFNFIDLCEKNFDTIKNFGNKLGLYIDFEKNELVDFIKLEDFMQKIINSLSEEEKEELGLNINETVIRNRIDIFTEKFANFFRDNIDNLEHPGFKYLKQILSPMLEFNKIPNLNIIDFYINKNCKSIFIDTELNFYSNFDEDYTLIGNILDTNIEVELFKWVTNHYKIEDLDIDKAIITKDGNLVTYFDKIKEPSTSNTSEKENEGVISNEGNN